jgi:hypothetical protein
MDPFLERHWEDVHASLIGYVRDDVQPQLSEDLVARMEEKVYVEDESDIRLRRPDVRVVEHLTDWRPEEGSVATAVLDEPMLLEPFGDPIRERSVLIYDSDGNRIVTAIEILSPWNKAPGVAVRTYLDKREKYLNSDINLVEIDLIRVGDWTKMIGRYAVPKRGLSTYRVTVTQPEMPGPYHYPIPLGRRLPTIKVPLRQQDAPARLNLQELIEKAYLMGRYNRLDYSRPCEPPFTESEQAWVNEVLRGRNSQ